MNVFVPIVPVSMLAPFATVPLQEATPEPPSAQTGCEPVAAFASSLPAGTVVESEKLPSEANASPEPPSEAVQPMLTLAACQTPSAEPQLVAGAFLSTMLPAIGPAVVQLPALSQTWRLFVEAFAVSVPAGT